MHGLKLPDNVESLPREWFKQRWLQKYYECKCCGKTVSIKSIIYRTDDDMLKFVCYRCAFKHEEPELFEDAFPILLN